MATNIVPGLFGVTPESYRQQQQAAFDARAFQNVQLTPQQQANLNIQSGAYGLAGGIGRMFGGEDPQMKIISGRNAVLQQTDLSNPESIMNGAKLFAQSGDNEAAMSLANYARQVQSELAGVEQKTAAAKASLAAASRTPKEGVAPRVQVATRIRELTMERENVSPYGSDAKAIDAEIANLERQEKAESATPEMKNATALALTKFPFGTPEFEAEKAKILERLTDKKMTAGPDAERMAFATFGKSYGNLTQGQAADVNKLIEKATKSDRFGVDREAVSMELFDKSFGDLTQVERAKVNTTIEENKGTVAAKSAPKIPDIKGVKDIPGLRTAVLQTIDPFRKTINAADAAVDAIDLSMSTNNFAAFRAGQTQFARAISGAGDLSQKELLAAGADPSLLGGTADYLSKLVSGTPTLDTQKQIKNTLIAIRKVSLKKGQEELDAQRALAKRAGFDAADFAAATDIPEFRPKPESAATGGKQIKLKSGKMVTVVEE